MEAIALDDLEPLLPAGDRITQGQGTLKLDLLPHTTVGWTIRGRLSLVDADLRDVGLVRKLCHFIGVEDLSPLAEAKAEIGFDLIGTVATLTHGRVVSGLPEMAIEPASWIDLATGQIEASVVLAAGARLGELPLLHPVGTLVKNLTRIHIHGRRDDPEEIIFSRD